MIDKKTMMDLVCSQLAVDYNCAPGDFLKDGLILTEARELEGRRPFPWCSPRLEMITMGNSIVVNASPDILPYVRGQLGGKTRDEDFSTRLLVGIVPNFLPDVGRIAPLDKPAGYEYELTEKNDIDKLYELPGFRNALQYDSADPRPDVLATAARYDGEVVAVAGASADCRTMWQIGIDVLKPYRGKGLAAALVNMLTLEVLKRGYIPYYGTDGSNVASMRTAVRAGYMPAWVMRHRISGDLTNMKVK